MPAWYPLKLTFHVRQYAFGDRLIPDRLGKRDVPAGIVAETWEISDYRDTTGTVTNGELAGRTLHDLVTAYSDEVVGAGWRGPHFPLLFKFLDASHMLPVHLHADDETARRKYGEPNGKTEAWHILWAAPGATILAGIKPGMTRDDLRRDFTAQDYDAVMPRHPIQVGDTVYVPGGVLHSFGPDTLIVEIQQTSDLAQSVMPTDLHGNRLDAATWQRNLAATLDELRTDVRPRPTPGLARPGMAPNRYIVCCAGPYFVLERWTLQAPHHEPAHPDRCLILSNIDGPVSIVAGEWTERLGRAESCLIPAALGAVTIEPEGTASLVVCYVPKLGRDIVTPLRDGGHPDEAIRALGDIPI